MQQKQNPVFERRVGNIQVSIWRNSGKLNHDWFSVTAVRNYRHDDQWKTSTSFSRDDLPIVSKLLDFAYAWIWRESKQGGPK